MLNRIVRFLLLCCVTALTSSQACADGINVHQTVQQALEYSPHLKALSHNHKAAEADLKRSFDRYFPSVDLMLGYGTEQYSDDTTRQAGADPDNSEWDPLTETSLKLTQMIYDGGEIHQQVSVQKALLDTVDYLIQDARLSVTMDGIIAHLEVCRQRELVSLAEKNFNFHQETFQSLSKMEQAGAGNIADVKQTQARLAQAQSDLFSTQADLEKAIANYVRITGTEPGKLALPGLPPTMPGSLKEALSQMEQNNPELLVHNAKLMEADARLGLAKTIYWPKVNLELTSHYIDQAEGDSSWQNTNDAMLVLRWNIFNGGQDKKMEDAALFRKRESLSNRRDKLINLKEMTSAYWISFLSLQRQEKILEEAKGYSQKTFDIYLNQFSVSRRSLLDVLSAKKEYYQSAQQLITTRVNLLISAYRILILTGGDSGMK